MAGGPPYVPMNDRTIAENLPNPTGDGGAAAVLRFAGFEFDLRRGELRGPDGAAIALRPKADALLRQFLAEPGRLLGRETLMAALWPATVVTDDSLVQCVGELRGALGDRGQQLIQTVPRRGYRLEATVAAAISPPFVPAAVGAMAETASRRSAGAPGLESAHASGAAPSATLAAASTAGSPLRRTPSHAKAILLVGLAIVTACLAVVGVRWQPALRVHIDETIAERSTVAILPFTTQGDEPALRQAADAVADDIAAQFSTRRGMRAIGRASTARLGADADPVASAARELHARSVVLGRVSAIGADPVRLAVDIQLVVANTRAVRWARRFETTPAALTGGTADIGLHVVNALRSSGDKLDVITATFDPHTTDPAELTLLGWNDLDRQTSPDDLLRARHRFEKALRSDSESLIALNGVAAAYAMLYSYPAREVTAEERVAYEHATERVHRMSPEDGTALLLWGGMQLRLGHPELALAALDKAIGIVPSYANGHTLRAEALMALGRTTEVQASADRAIALAHADVRSVGRAYVCAAKSALMRGDDGAGLELARRGVAQTPWSVHAHGALAAAEALAGNAERAAGEIAEVRRLWPGATIARYDERRPSTQASFKAQRQRLYAALRQAGLPER